MSDHVSSVVRSCFFQLRQLRSVRHSLPVEARKALVHCFSLQPSSITAIAILYGVSGAVLRRLQTESQCSCQTCCWCRQTSAHHTEYSEICIELPVKERILYKIGILSFTVCKKDWTGFTSWRCSQRVSDVYGRSTLRSAARGDFIIHSDKNCNFWPPEFSSIPVQLFGINYPLTWGIKTFRISSSQCKLKTLLFEQAYRALL